MYFTYHLGPAGMELVYRPACCLSVYPCLPACLPALAALPAPPAQVVEEGLRMLCVHRRLNDTSQAWKWWDYMTKFMSVCTMVSSRFDRCRSQQRACPRCLPGREHHSCRRLSAL